MEVMRKTGARKRRRERERRELKRKGLGGESKGRQRKRKEETEGRQSRSRVRGSSRSCGLPVTDSASDNAFIMGKGEQRKGLIHRRVRES